VLDADDLTALDGFVGLTATYEKARGAMEELMTQATKYFDVIANALIAVAAEYEWMERTNEHGFRRHERELGGHR
jgi:hypothetical protein